MRQIRDRLFDYMINAMIMVGATVFVCMIGFVLGYIFASIILKLLLLG